MRLDYSYDVHRDVEAARFRHRERDLDHRRVLRTIDQATAG